MTIEYLEHINIHSADMDGLIAYYSKVLGMRHGERPNFDRDGAWLFVGDVPVLHLVKRAKLETSGEPRIEHYAMRCKGLGETMETLRKNKCAYWANYIPETHVVQIHTNDPDGNHVELAFSGDERGDDMDLSAYDGS
ncbi:MAG: hypothetical protein O2912_11675 [Proteobacteria bacterium]|nr:hypothetical protein [Pseudomonadota bacterium]